MKSQQKFPWLWMIFVELAFMLATPAIAARKNPTKMLPFKQLTHFQISLENGLYAVYRDGSEVITSPRQAKYYFLSSYDQAAKEQDLGFGTLHTPTDKSERMPFPDKDPERRIRGILPLDSILFMLDAERRQFLLWHKDQKIWLRPADLILDLIRPPSDPRGEPTRSEVADLRRSFVKSFAKVLQDPEIIGGIAPIPPFWKDRDGSQFLLLLRVPGTPLLTVRCQGKNRGNCQAVRACFVHGLPSNLVEELSGLAVDPLRKEILIGSPGEQRILRFKAPSCYHIAHGKDENDLGLPEELKDLSSLFIDSDRNLWLTVLRPDIYKSGSLFRFDAKIWADDSKAGR